VGKRVTRPLLTSSIGFSSPVVDKVERLLEVLAALQEDPLLGRAFTLHGGTALNLFYDRAPRLSVDVDLMFTGAVDRDVMTAMRPEIDRRFREVVGALGYVVQATNDEHSGRTYRVKYPGSHVKVDVSYLARIALLQPELRACRFADPLVTFPVLQLPELAAGKVKALMERVAARDLFDLFRLSMEMPALFDDARARALTIRAACTADSFPRMLRPTEALGRFAQPQVELTEPLYSVLRADEAPEYETMLENVSRWLAPLDDFSAAEIEFVRLLSEHAEYRPQLLFSEWPDVLDRARVDPVMEWKVVNLKKRPAPGR